jgi:ABC-type Fe3+ transport system permease subunit
MVDKKRIKERAKHIRVLLVPLILSIGLLVASKNWATETTNEDLQTILSLIPMIPGIWMAFAIVSVLNKFDELEQRTSREGIEISFFITLIFTNTIGVMQLTKDFNLNAIGISLFMVFTLLAGKLFAKYRYR